MKRQTVGEDPVMLQRAQSLSRVHGRHKRRLASYWLADCLHAEPLENETILQYGLSSIDPDVLNISALDYPSACLHKRRPLPSPIGVGNGFRRPRPPNRACGSPAHGSPVGGFLIGIGSPASRLQSW
jgi:hypothetical protein